MNNMLTLSLFDDANIGDVGACYPLNKVLAYYTRICCLVLCVEIDLFRSKASVAQQ